MVTLKTPISIADFQDWATQLPAVWTPEQLHLVQRAHAVVLEAIPTEERERSLLVGDILADLGADPDVVAAGLLSQGVRAGHIDPHWLRREFGPRIAALVEGVTKLDFIGDLHQQTAGQHQQLESLRKMLLTMVQDVGVVLVKLALRLARLRYLKDCAEAEQRLLAQETRDIFAPLANRLGIGKLKWELEDLAMRYLEPVDYKSLAKALDERRQERESYIQQVMAQLRTLLAEAGIQATVSGRVKHIFSIWRKMQRKNRSLEQLFDLRAVRVTVDSVTDCYAALGVVHSRWQPLPREFDDYIANPKANGYQSLHTAVIGSEGRTLEIQIRTATMHQQAELGIAAHWRYKEGSGATADSRQMSWLRQMLERTDGEDDHILEDFHNQSSLDRVYVITPKGTIIDLQAGATPLDFAYLIHTEVGHGCRGAKVNGRIVPLTYELQSGDHVDVLTAKTGTPSRDWLSPHLGYLRTGRAKQKVRQWFKQQDHDKNVTAGKANLEREFQRLDIATRSVDLQPVAVQFNYQRVEDLYAAIGYGVVTLGQVINRVQEQVLPAGRGMDKVVPRPPSGGQPSAEIRVRGVGNLLIQLGNCCQPAPQEPIVGYITQNRGVTIHRKDCPNVLALAATRQERLIEVDWGDEPQAWYPVDVLINAYDRQGLLRDISAVIANEGANVIKVETTSDRESTTARMALTIEVADLSQLHRLLDRIDRLPNVIDAHRRR